MSIAFSNAAGSGCLAGPGKLLAEFFNSTGFVNTLLRAGVKRMRFGTDVKFEQRILFTVFHLDLFAS